MPRQPIAAVVHGNKTVNFANVVAINLQGAVVVAANVVFFGF